MLIEVSWTEGAREIHGPHGSTITSWIEAREEQFRKIPETLAFLDTYFMCETSKGRPPVLTLHVDDYYALHIYIDRKYGLMINILNQQEDLIGHVHISDLDWRVTPEA